MAVREIARRLINGVWTTVDVEEDGGDGAQLLQSVTVPISSAEILALHTTPKVLVPAVADTIILPQIVVGNFAAGVTPYSGTPNYRLFIGNTFGTADIAIAHPASSFLTASDNIYYFYFGKNVIDDNHDAPPSLVVSVPFQFDLSGAVTAGDGTLEMTVFYLTLEVV
jgi:hypothetical protein